MRYDAAIIGAGADGLAAAATLAKSGLKTIVIERATEPGGRCVTREFHPGFRASPFFDELAPIPPEIFWSLDLARRGVVLVPPPFSTARWPDRSDRLNGNDPLLAGVRAETATFLSHARAEASPGYTFFSARPEQPWPDSSRMMTSLSGALAACGADRAAHAMAYALTGRAAHPLLAGSAAHLLAPGAGGSGLVAGGLARLTDALVAAASDASAEIACGLEVADIQRRSGGIGGVRLADGSEIAAKTVLSTLDAKRTFLSLFAWKDLPAAVAQRCASFRMAGSMARLLLALDRLPGDSRRDLAGPIYPKPCAEDFAEAYAAWREGRLAKQLPVSLRFPSVLDPSLCPVGAAVMTATIGCVPAKPFDGPWTREKRGALQDNVLASIEDIFPDLRAHILASDLIVPPDIEEALGLTDGDLRGGEIAPDQMLDLRFGPRTPLKGLYLAGPSSAAAPFGACVAGVIAAHAIAADLGRGP